MKRVLILLLLVSGYAHADWRNGDDPFDASKVRGDTMVVKWVRVDNIQATCDRISRQRGMGGFPYAVDACTFWEDHSNTCVMYTPRTTTQHIIGHEMRHCFQGSFH
jgi:hypothetical protein